MINVTRRTENLNSYAMALADIIVDLLYGKDLRETLSYTRKNIFITAWVKRSRVVRKIQCPLAILIKISQLCCISLTSMLKTQKLLFWQTQTLEESVWREDQCLARLSVQLMEWTDYHSGAKLDSRQLKWLTTKSKLNALELAFNAFNLAFDAIDLVFNALCNVGQVRSVEGQFKSTEGQIKSTDDKVCLTKKIVL